MEPPVEVREEKKPVEPEAPKKKSIFSILRDRLQSAGDRTASIFKDDSDDSDDSYSDEEEKSAKY